MAGFQQYMQGQGSWGTLEHRFFDVVSWHMVTYLFLRITRFLGFAFVVFPGSTERMTVLVQRQRWLREVHVPVCLGLPKVHARPGIMRVTVPKFGYLLGPQNKDRNVFGSIFGPWYFGKLPCDVLAVCCSSSSRL